MGLLRKIKIHLESWMAVKAGIPMPAFLEAKETILREIAPKGESADYLSIQDDGSIIRIEPQRGEEDNKESDELLLRKKMGDIYANTLQRKASQSLEEMSRQELEIREALEQTREIRERRGEILRETSDIHFLKQKGILCILGLLILALGEIPLFGYLFADWLGIDPARFLTDFRKQPISSIGVFAISIITFGGLLYLAKKAILSSKKWLWLGFIFIIALFVGKLRAEQLAAINGYNLDYTLPLIYALATFGFPFIGALLEIQIEDSLIKAKKVESKIKRLVEEERFI
jgi:hypothetical protein